MTENKKSICGNPVRVMILSLVCMLVLAACNGPVGPYSNQPTATSSICLEGIWAIRNPEIFYRYALPPGAFDQSALEFKDSSGGIGYRFDSKGVLTIEAVNLIGRFDVKQGAELAPLEIKISGFASGAYTIKGDTVSLNNALSSEMPFLALYDGESMMDTKKAAEFAPLFLPPYTTARFECSADKLTLQILNFPGYQEKLEFQRMTK